MAEEQERVYSMEMPLPDGGSIMLHDTSGERRTAQEFARAYADYKANRPLQGGFVALQPGSQQSGMRESFEAINAVAQPALKRGGEAVALGVTSPLGALLGIGEQYGVVPQGTAASLSEKAKAVGGTGGEFVGGMIKTPERAGMTAGTLATAPVIGAGAGPGMLLRNAVIGGTGAVLGGTGAATSMGETVTPARAVTQFIPGALGGSLQGVTQQFLNTYFSPSKRDQMSKEITERIVKESPALANDPNAFTIAMSNPDKISQLTQRMTEGLRGNVDDITSTIVTDINNTLPTSLTKGQQNTLRAHVRGIVKAQNEYMDSLIDPATAATNLADVNTKINNMMGEIIGFFPNIKNINPTTVRVYNVIDDVANKLGDMRQAAEVLGYMKQAGAGGRWDEGKFVQLIRDKYLQQNPGGVMRDVGDILAGGPGKSLTELPANVGQPIQTPSPLELLKEGFGLISHPMKTAANVLKKGQLTETPLLPWQGQTGYPIRGRFTKPLNIELQGLAVQSSGQEAIERFAGGKK